MFKKPKKGMVKPMKRAFVYLLTFLFLLPCLAFASSIKAGAEGYATPDMLDRTDNLFLSYTFNYKNPASGHRSKEGYKPLVGYIDPEGKLRDIFFDSFLFLPCVTPTEGNRALFRHDKYLPAIFSDWQMFIDDCFIDGYNIPALNQAVGEVKAELGSAYTSFKANVFLTILYPTQTQTDFGDVDGDGKTENFSNIEDRKKAVKWIVDTQIQRFNNGNYQNLNLVGFYWFEEFISTDSEERTLVTYMNDYVHSLKLKTIWIPYYTATGYNEWDTYGFNVACYQPNYMFVSAATKQRVTTACNTAKRLGMGIEIEAAYSMFTSVEYYNRYLDYLSICTTLGANQGIKMYYNEAVDGVFYTAYKSDIPEIRRIYDYTYKYASKTLNPAELIYVEEKPKYEGYDIISVGCPYTATSPYTNSTLGYGSVSGTELTDGVFGKSDYDTEWVAFHVSKTESDGCYHIDVDLGKTFDILTLFSLELHHLPGSGITLPESVEFLVSTNGSSYKSIGYAEFTRSAFAYNQATLTPDKPVTARFVRAKIKPGTHVFVFVSEMTIGVPKGSNVVPALRANKNAPVLVNNDEKYCALLGEQIKASAISGQFSHTVTIRTADGLAAGGSTMLGTGGTITYFHQGKQADTYSIVVFGDIDGDAEISSIDYLLTKKAFIGSVSLNAAQLAAADVNLDGSVDSLDILLIKRHIIGTDNIYTRIP